MIMIYFDKIKKKKLNAYCDSSLYFQQSINLDAILHFTRIWKYKRFDN